jgi:hypothetical protein
MAQRVFPCPACGRDIEVPDHYFKLAIPCASCGAVANRRTGRPFERPQGAPGSRQVLAVPPPPSQEPPPVPQQQQPLESPLTASQSAAEASPGIPAPEAQPQSWHYPPAAPYPAYPPAPRRGKKGLFIGLAVGFGVLLLLAGLAGAGVALVSAKGGNVPSKGAWLTVRSNYGWFSADFPVKPRFDVQHFETEMGKRTLRQWIAVIHGVPFEVSYYDLGNEPVMEYTFDPVAAASAIAEVLGELKSVTRRQLDGVEAREGVIQQSFGRRTFVMLARRGNRVYTLAVSNVKDSSEEAARRFFSDFRFLPIDYEAAKHDPGRQDGVTPLPLSFNKELERVLVAEQYFQNEWVASGGIAPLRVQSELENLPEGLKAHCRSMGRTSNVQVIGKLSPFAKGGSIRVTIKDGTGVAITRDIVFRITPFVKPPAAAGPVPTRVRLPASAQEVQAVQNGDLLVFRLQGTPLLAVVDVVNFTLLRTIRIPSSNSLFAAGGHLLVVYDNETSTFTVHHLLDSTQTRSAPSPFVGFPIAMTMGGNNSDIVMLRVAEGTRENFLCRYGLLNTRTLEGELLERRPPRFRDDDHEQIRLCPNGTVVGAWATTGGGRRAVGMLRGRDLSLHYNYTYKGEVLPVSGRNIAVTGRGFVLAASGQLIHRHGHFPLYPDLSGNFYVGADREVMRVYSADTHRQIRALPSWLKEGIRNPSNEVVVPISRHKVLVGLSPGRDEVIFHPFDPVADLAASDDPYVVVTSSPPWEAQGGRTLTYEIEAATHAASFAVELMDGPEGAVVEGARLTWPVPADYHSIEAEFLLRVSNLTGESTFHSFRVSVTPLEAPQDDGQLPDSDNDAPQGE